MNTPEISARERILEAADGLFGEVGFDAAATRRIAELSGVNKALIHYHFKNKKDLFDRVLDRYYARLGEVLRGSLEGEGAVRHRLRRVLDAYVDFLADNRSFSRMVQREVSDGRHIERITGHMVPLFQGAAALIEQAYPATRGGELSAPQLLASFYGMVVSYYSYAPVLEGLMGEDPSSPVAVELRKRHLYRMLDLVLDALESEGRSPS